MKLYGQVMLKKYAAGWLLSASALSKDAKGIEEERESEVPAERRRLQIYTPDKLVKRLISANIIVDPQHIPRDRARKHADDCYLLLTKYGEFWAIILLDQETNLRRSVHLYNAADGEPAGEALIAKVKETDTSLSDLEWVTLTEASLGNGRQKLLDELQSIVPVQMADHWADYRPSRPEDFVGRDQLQQEVLQLFDNARLGISSTRLFAVKAPSGWGKSSFVLKVAQRAASVGHGKRNFVYAVDSRGASSQRFAELAIYSAIMKAMQSGFINTVDDLEVGGADDPFSSKSMQNVLRQLVSDGKIICLIFDQFEELLYKEDLSLLFNEIRRLCDAIVEAQANFLIGFSWKTDGTIPPEHNAYYMWHSLSDHRREFELGPLSDSEVGTAINRFSRELGQAVAPQMRRLLHDHSQGFPWLLKKLCIHVLEQIKSGLDQGLVFVRALKIEELFKKDLVGLSATEFACVRQVASDAPADFYKISAAFGDDIVNQLLDKRLIIRSGPKLSIYWDIFREYVLTERVPYIPTTYVPQANLPSYLTALRLLIRDQQTTYEMIAKELEVSAGTADNIVRDMVMVGHAEASRQAGKVACLTNEDEARETFIAFCESHTIYRALDERFGRGKPFTDEDAIELTRQAYSERGVSDKIMSPYGRRLLSWLIAAGLTKKEGRLYYLTGGAGARISLDIRPARRGAGIFLGSSIPAKATAAYDLISSGGDISSVEARWGRYPLVDLTNLKLIDSGVIVGKDADLSPNAHLLTAVLGTQTVRLTMAMEEAQPNANGLAIGRMLAEHLKVTWSDSSCMRIGNSLKRWARWCRLQSTA